MFRRFILPVLIAAALTGPAAAEERPGGAFNLRIVSDSVPDFSSREAFVYSALSNWTTDREKALAQFRWMHRCRRVGPYQPEDSRPVLDPILFFNSYGITFCSMVSEMNCSLWEAWGKKHRVVDLYGHVVSEVHYGGRWHLFDNDFCNYWINETGEVASIADLTTSRVHGNVADLKPGEYYVFDHCPTASAPRGKIIMGPSAWSVIAIARYWYPGPHKAWPRLNYTGSHAGHRYRLGIRRGETYTRHWRPTGTGDLYARPLTNGKDPALGSKLKNCRGNGEWTWVPDLRYDDEIFALQNVTRAMVDGRAALKSKDPSTPAFVVFRVMAANVVTSATLAATLDGAVRFSVSGNHGLAWEPVAMHAIRGDKHNADAAITKPIAGRLEYLIRADLTAGSALRGLVITTITQVNQRTLPALHLGTNKIAAVSDEHLEYVTFNPLLADHRYKDEVDTASGWQSIERPHDYDPSIRGVGKSELVLRATAPRNIRHVRMAATLHRTEPGTDSYFKVSFDGGRTWQNLAHIPFDGAPYDTRVSVETRDVPAGTREVLMKYYFDWGGNGLVNVVAEAGYEPAGERMPYDVTYHWAEYRGGKWVERSHTERVKEGYHAWRVNVGGTRPPRMDRVALQPVDDKRRLGYSDGEDVGDRFARPGYRLVCGKRISIGCPYTVSRPPSKAYPDSLPIVHPPPNKHVGWIRPPRTVGTKDDPRTLTDDSIGICHYYWRDDVNFTDKRNARHVGEIVAWEPGDEVVVTLDLGTARTVGGAAVAALQPNRFMHYPAAITVETSADGKTFAKAGETTWEACFFPPADALLWEGHDSPNYKDLPAGGIRDFTFAFPFEKPVAARYVRFRLAPPADKSAGIALWELQAFDALKKVPFSDRIRLPEPPGK